MLPGERQILAVTTPVEVRGWLQSERQAGWLPGEGPHHGALTGGSLYSSLVLSSASLVQQDQEGQLMLTRLAKILMYKPYWPYVYLKYGLELSRREYFSF